VISLARANKTLRPVPIGGRDLSPMMSSRDQTWNTPRWFIDRLEKALGRVGLDPCSNRWSDVRARVEYSREKRRDGLKLTWQGLGLTYVNPPFGREIERWMARCSLYGANGVELVALVPARTDTAWWHRTHSTCSAAILWRGRFAFRRRASRLRGNAPFPSSLFYWGPRVGAFLDEFRASGIVVPGGVCPLHRKRSMEAMEQRALRSGGAL
jgi:hypothetical protein